MTEVRLIIFVEVLQEYSSGGRHYETRFDKILETTNSSTAVRKPLKPKAKSSAKIVHRPTAIDQADIAARYQQGWSARPLAEAYDASKTNIIIVLREAGIPIRGKVSATPRARRLPNITQRMPLWLPLARPMASPPTRSASSSCSRRLHFGIRGIIRGLVL
jgi:hypothetical protein